MFQNLRFDLTILGGLEGAAAGLTKLQSAFETCLETHCPNAGVAEGLPDLFSGLMRFTKISDCPPKSLALRAALPSTTSVPRFALPALRESIDAGTTLVIQPRQEYGDSHIAKLRTTSRRHCYCASHEGRIRRTRTISPPDPQPIHPQTRSSSNLGCLKKRRTS